MTQARRNLVSIADTPYYHIVSRCVRRAFLCGTDHATGQCYEHRRQWIVDRIRLLSSVFCIDICSYAVMSNHYHIVLKLSPLNADEWTTHDIISRWSMLFKGTLLTQKYLKDEPLTPAEQVAVSDISIVWKKRLQSLSWFMKCLNEPIARQANQEDQCTGHFWESRYKSQALLTEQALLSCMAYVDLNPIRAEMAATPEASDFTSIKERIQPQFDLAEAIKNSLEPKGSHSFTLPIKSLLPFEGNVTETEQAGLLYHFNDYLELVDWTGRIIREDKRGSISQHIPPILNRLGVPPDDWLKNSMRFEEIYLTHFKKKKATSA